ncbi:MAG: hypothetical protein JSV36_17270 [Anaerolineae bacterium]|nr:MAG: hypothetical protein JSV36_17270 [Anaerolineae bacterium]
MRLRFKLFLGLRHKVRDLLPLLLLASGAVILAALLSSPAGVTASWTTFQSSPVDTPTPQPTDTPVSTPTPAVTPVPTDTPEVTPTPTPTDTPVPDATGAPVPDATDTPVQPPTATPSPTVTLPPATPTSSALPTTRTTMVTPELTAIAIQMPLLPSTATSEPPTPTPTSTAAAKSLLSPDSVGWLVVVVLLTLAAVIGLVLGGVLRNLTQRSGPLCVYFGDVRILAFGES